MRVDNLLEDLRGKDVDQSELEQLFAAHFQGARGVTPRQIEYQYAGQGAPAITLCYDGDGELNAIYPGPALKPNTVAELREKIERNLLTPTAPVIGTQILFAGVPTTGSFRYRDVCFRSFQCLKRPLGPNRCWAIIRSCFNFNFLAVRT